MSVGGGGWGVWWLGGTVINAWTCRHVSKNVYRFIAVLSENLCSIMGFSTVLSNGINTLNKEMDAGPRFPY